MPQLFPMNWILLTILFSLSTTISFIYIFYIPMKLNKFTMLPTSHKCLTFKW